MTMGVATKMGMRRCLRVFASPLFCARVNGNEFLGHILL